MRFDEAVASPKGTFLGINCPKCSGVALIYDTRRIEKAVRRRRECTQCGHRFTTRETVL